MLAVPGLLLLGAEWFLATFDGHWDMFRDGLAASVALLIPSGVAVTIGIVMRSRFVRARRDDALERNAITHDRFTREAQDVLDSAVVECIRWKHSHVGTAHLLLALLQHRGGTAARILQTLGDPDALRQALETGMRQADSPDAGVVPSGSGRRGYTARAISVLQASVEEAQRLHRPQSGPEHILLASCAEEQGLAGKVLRDAGLTRAVVRSHVLRTTDATE